jgi:hypothetical protein
MADRYAESTGRLESALRTAAAARTATDDEAARLDTELAGRQQALGQVLARLGEATAGAAPAGGRGGTRTVPEA